MSRYFNIAGPCNPHEHYMIDASIRLKNVGQLIDQRQYFVIHAARQSGKTTLLLNLTEELNRAGRYYALYCSLEAVQGITDPKEGMRAIIGRLKLSLDFSTIPGGKDFALHPDFDYYANIVQTELSSFCMTLDKPLVIFFDDMDKLNGGTLISFLSQLRIGYNTRFHIPFLHSLALVGIHNISSYKVLIEAHNEYSEKIVPFNIVSEALTLRNFNKEEIRELYLQHTSETGQRFEEEAIEKVWQQTQGQPWLVNAIAWEIIVKILRSNYSQIITAGYVDQAIQTIITRRDTHIDSLLERLKEELGKPITDEVTLMSEKSLAEDWFSEKDDQWDKVL